MIPEQRGVKILEKLNKKNIYTVLEINYLHPKFGDDTDKAVSESINYLDTLKK